MHVGHAEFHAGAFVGHAAIEQQKQNIGGDNLVAIEREDGARGFIAGHFGEGRGAGLDAVALRQEDRIPQRFDTLGQREIEGAFGFVEKRPGKVDAPRASHAVLFRRPRGRAARVPGA